jgi:hypothetical protein
MFMDNYHPGSERTPSLSTLSQTLSRQAGINKVRDKVCDKDSPVFQNENCWVLSVGRNSRCPDSPKGVAQICNLPYRRIAFCQLRDNRGAKEGPTPADFKSAIQQIVNLRYRDDAGNRELHHYPYASAVEFPSFLAI